MGVTLRTPFGSGILAVMGKSYEVRNGTVEVADDHEANWCIEHRACVPVGAAPKWKTSKRIVVKRGRGQGDLLMVVPVIRAMKQANPGAHICLACDTIFVELLKGVKWIDRIVTQPQLVFHRDQVWVVGADGTKEEYDCWVNLDNIAEQSPDVATLHRVDIFGKVLGFTPGSFDKSLEYIVTAEEREWARVTLADKGVSPKDKVLAMALRSTCFNRNLPGASEHGPGDVNRQIATMAACDGWRVLLLDHDRRLGFEGDGVINMTGRTTLRQAGALMERADLYIGPDTGAWHLACALKRPNLVYFGAMNWKLRVTGPYTKVVFKNTPCYPCDRYDCNWKERVACMRLTARDIWPEAKVFEAAKSWEKAGYATMQWSPFDESTSKYSEKPMGLAPMKAV